MSDSNSQLCPTISGAAVFPLCQNGARPKTRSPGEVFRSLASDLRRPLRAVVASLNGETRGARDRYSRSPSIPPVPEQSPPPSDLSIVDSKELIREILRRVGEDPDREGLKQTPDRIMRSWKELYGGYAQCAEDVLVTQFQAEQYDEMVLLRDI